MPSTSCSGSAPSKDSTLIARRILTYRHQLVASRAYLENCKPPKAPQDLLGHRLLAFSHWKPENSWSFVNANGRDKKTLTFKPYLSMNDYTGLARALLAGAGIGDLPPVVQPDLLRDGRLIEVMPKWRFRSFNLSAVHLGNRYIPRPVRLFKEFASKWRRSCFQCFRLEEGTGSGVTDAAGAKASRE
jgi:DNA-binding transcriptional LysR family regulator